MYLKLRKYRVLKQKIDVHVIPAQEEYTHIWQRTKLKFVDVTIARDNCRLRNILRSFESTWKFYGGRFSFASRCSGSFLWKHERAYIYLSTHDSSVNCPSLKPKMLPNRSARDVYLLFHRSPIASIKEEGLNCPAFYMSPLYSWLRRSSSHHRPFSHSIFMDNLSIGRRRVDTRRWILSSDVTAVLRTIYQAVAAEISYHFNVPR